MGVHVSIGENPYPDVDASYVEFWIDNFFVFSGDFLNTKLLKPSANKYSYSGSNQYSKGYANTTKTAEATEKSNDTETDDKFPIVPVIIGAAVLVIVVVVVIIIAKKKK